MIERRQLLTMSGLLGALAPGGAEGNAQQLSPQDAKDIANAIRDIRTTLAAESSFAEIAPVRAKQLEYLKANGKFPDFIDVGSDVWYRRTRLAHQAPAAAGVRTRPGGTLHAHARVHRPGATRGRGGVVRVDAVRQPVNGRVRGDPGVRVVARAPDVSRQKRSATQTRTAGGEPLRVPARDVLPLDPAMACGRARRRADAPAVLSVGDLHIENFGTWRDVEGDSSGASTISTKRAGCRTRTISSGSPPARSWRSNRTGFTSPRAMPARRSWKGMPRPANGGRPGGAGGTPPLAAAPRRKRTARPRRLLGSAAQAAPGDERRAA